MRRVSTFPRAMLRPLVLRPLVAAAALVTAMALGAPVARAEPLPLSTTARVGRPPRPTPLTVEVEDGTARLRVGRGRGAVTRALPGTSPSEATVEEVALAGGARVAVVRVTGDGTSAAALVGGRARPEVLWAGDLEPHGDRGERRRDVLQVADRTGDGELDVVVGIATETHRICGQDDTLLDIRAVDPRTVSLRPVVLRRLPAEAPETEVEATAASPGPTGPPLLRALHFRRASSSAGGARDPSLVPAPVALSDGDPASVWQEGVAGPGRWEFATGRFGAGQYRIRAFALTLAPAAPQLASRVGAPRHLWLVGDAGERLRVTVPEEVAREPGARAWVVPPEPLGWHCVSVVLDDPWPNPAGGEPSTVALAEVEAYTDLDFGEGLDTLVEELVADGERGAEAARLLGTLGAPAVSAVVEAWETLTPTGRRRSIRVLSDNARDMPEARRALGTAASDADRNVREDALAALVAAGEVAADELARVAGDPESPGAEPAAIALARMAPAEAMPLLLEALDRPGASERPGLRRALRTAADRGGEPALAALDQWRAAEPPVPARAAAALALARVEDARDRAADLVDGAVDEAERFEDRWRLVKACAHLPPREAADGWLAGLARGAEEWMLRAAAVEALGARGSADAAAVARDALDDDYPRVRVAAIAALAGDAGSVEPVAGLARRDRWPMVRAAAVASLAPDERARRVVVAAVEDRSQVVRAAAVDALRSAGDRDAWRAVARRLVDDEEWPVVHTAAIRYGRELCVRELAGPIAEALRRGLKRDAWAPDLDVAVEAVGALAALGGEEADEMLDRAERQGAPAAIRAAAVRARREVTRCGSP